ncbi:CDP-glycerol glycerophosphotransferase family protein [Aliifodinibius sp. S!AR15-10]|uniref:CDP-glycerol glycerophosphotransferase family protein n=1 Tax=Aliifodinibius sp. S!AR15-10 TaxID=2950437 RepID=UPI002866EF78|nr:CDP-glycerol glycerophosphotransferase family protein [Aliifodinibius sp. S!AR15-10]MDR8393035.1 CDP-glycerol glycerophosphotransferase family protein [Aliifodinibius sp. S!AR15-10]
MTPSMTIQKKEDVDLFQLKIQRQQERYAATAARLKNKATINVAFLVIHSSIWKYHRVYKLMEADPRFHPTVVVCPYLKDGKAHMSEEMDKTLRFMQHSGYNVLKTYDEENDSWIDIKSELQPDIVFFSVPYDYTRDEYRLANFRYALTCYVPYFFTTNGKKGSNYDGPFHNLVWRSFYETEIHKKYAEEYARNRGENVVVSGYPRLDDFLFADQQMVSDPWNSSSDELKRIIWAPHHTIDGQGQGLNYSTFKTYHELFKEIATAYSDKIQIAFKPHPLLKQKLYKDEDWGKKRTDQYYRFWDNLQNGLLAEADYTDLFLTSDVLIHDCSSFMAEYLATGKPSLYLLHDLGVRERLHQFGKMALHRHYQAQRGDEILKFIEHQALQQKDPMQEVRTRFVNSRLMPPNEKTAAENIVNYVKNEISH